MESVKPQLLLLHGALGSKDILEPLRQLTLEFAEAKSMNFPGHGGEPIPQTGFSAHLFSESIGNFIQQEFDPTKPVYIFGYSMGGYMALLSSLRGNSLIRGIITLATKMLWTPQIAAQESAMLNPDTMLEKVPQFAAQLEKRHAPADWKMLLKCTAKLMQELGETDPLNAQRLSAVNIHCTFMLGDRDKMVTLDETAAAYKATSGSSLCVLPNTPHPLEKVDPKRLAFEIESFIHSII